MEQFQLRFLAGAHCRFLFKKLLENLLLGSLWFLDKSLGTMYYVLDVGFEGLEASKAKDIFLPHNLFSSSSSSSISSRELSPASSSVTSSFASTPRSSSELGVEDTSTLLPGFNSIVNHHDIHKLSVFCSAGDGNQHKISKPRRAGIIAERKNAKNSNKGSSCTCWGWQVEEEPLDDEQFPMHDTLQELPVNDDKEEEEDDGYNIHIVGSSPGSSAFRDVTVRWSECQCPECTKLWMPMSRARSRLHVQRWNTSHHNCKFELNRNKRKSPVFLVSGTSKDLQAREPEVGDRSLRFFGTAASSTGEAAAEQCERNSNMMIGANSLPQNSVDFGRRNEKKERTGVIFLHGIFSSSDFWFDSNIIPMLDGEIKERHMIFAPDMLGCGRSPRPHDSVYTLSDQVDALEHSVLRKYNLDSFHIVAHSMGTIPALAVAARFPRRVRSLTLIAPVYAGRSDPKREGGEEIVTHCKSILSFQDPWSMAAIRSLTALEYYNINRCFGHLLFSRHQLLVPIFQRLLQKRWPRSFVRDYLAVTHDAAWHIVHNTVIGGSHAVVPALRKLRDRGMRVFVIHGTEDTSCPFKQSASMAQHFENVVFAPVKGMGHVNVVLGRHDEVLRHLEEEIRLGDRNFTNSSATCKLS
ncbi:unnamed protein product [Calypogeia fissa]